MEGRRRARAQSTLEFAFVAPLFLMCFFAVIDAALWAVQTSASVSAAEQAVRLAAAASSSAASETTPSPTVLVDGIRHQLQEALFGATVVAWCDPRGGPCPSVPAPGSAATDFSGCPTSPQEVERYFGARTVAVCDQTSAPAPACPALVPSPPRCGDPPMVTVRVIGYLASLVPPISGFGWRGGEIPIDITATTHTLRFAP
jgi:hypothetical protein